MFKSAKKTLFAAVLMSGIFLGASAASAAPYSGKTFDLVQPDGSFVKVQVYGDEFYQRVESPDGYTLIRDPKTNWICYARLNQDGTEFVSTGVVYKNAASNAKKTSSDLEVEKGLEIAKESILSKVTKAKNEKNWDSFIKESFEAAKEKGNLPSGATNSIKNVEGSQMLMAEASAIRNVTGLTLLIDFSDEQSTIPRAEISDMVNKVGYTGYYNNGSVHDYFNYFSGGKLEYNNVVTAYYRAKKPKSYYDNNIEGKAGELIREALQDLKDKGFNFSQLTLDSDGTVTAFNVLYAGYPTWGWSKGLWPHAGGIDEFVAGSAKFTRYQISNIGGSLSIGTFVHENGHMLCGWPDTYDYGYESCGTGAFDLMSSGDGKNPQPPNPYFRSILSGWGDPVDLNSYADGTRIDVPQNSLNPFYAKNSDATEYFMVESINRTGYRSNMPGDGLLIWHIDKNGDNSSENMTLKNHYMVSVEQADGEFGLENNYAGEAKDFFYAGNNDSFGPFTKPNSLWWRKNDEPTISLKNINAAGTQFTYYKALSTDITEGGTVSASVTSPAGQESTNAFDNSLQSSWGISAPSGSITYQFKDDGAFLVNRYSISSSTGLSERDPKSWILEGSNDKITWAPVDSRSGVDFTGRLQTKLFEITNTNYYKYYRFTFTNHSGSALALSEIQMFGTLNTAQTLFASSENTSTGGAKGNAFDGDTSTKWRALQNTGWITYNFKKPTIITNYALTSASDAPERDPASWELLASNDNINWVPLDTRKNQAFTNRSQRNIYSADNITPYVFYKLNIKSTYAGQELQLGEAEFLTVTSDGENQPNEGKEKAFDGSTKTKWLTFNSTGAITMKYMNPVAIGSYAVSSANDYSGRNPKEWTLYGSNDNESWTPLDYRNDQIFTDYFQRKVYNTTNTTSYLYYKLDITANNGDGILQLSEIEYMPKTTVTTNGNLQVDFYNGSKANFTNNSSLNFKVTNTGTEPVNLSDVKIRYYYTIDGERAQNFYCDWSSRGTQYTTGKFVKMNTPATNADYYVEVGFLAAAGTLAKGESVTVNARMSKSDWSNYNQTNDYSFNSISSTFEKWDKTPAYLLGNIAWGIEPN